ncbi:HTH-type transcriptional regulator YesS [compost metagenome]
MELSPSYVSKLFRQQTGLTMTDYLIAVRMEKAKQFLTDYPQLKNYEVSSMLGYSDPVYFNKLFKKTVGLTPKEYKEKHNSP